MNLNVFQNNVLPTGEKMVEGFSITLEMIDRHQSGVYQCTASNGVGDPVTVDMQLDVLCEFIRLVSAYLKSNLFL